MPYLTESEFIGLGFDDVDDFDKLANRAEVTINLYTNGIYQRYIDFDKDFDFRKQAVKLAMAYQIAYLDSSGILSADDKQSLSSVSIGRTSISYKGSQNTVNQRLNLSIDAENILKQAGFSLIVGVDYDR